MLHSVFADLEVFCNFLVRKSGDHSGNDFKFAWGEAESLVTRNLVSGIHQAAQILHEIRDGLAADPVLPIQNGANALQKDFGAAVFENDSASSQLQCLDDLLPFCSRSQQYNPHGRSIQAQLPKGLETMSSWHSEIEEQDVGFETADKLYRFHSIAGFGHNFEARLRLQKTAKAI